MHGQTTTRRSDELNPARVASAQMIPASNAAPNGCRKGFELRRARPRRNTAPAAALKNMTTAGCQCWMPKITASATAADAAASVNSQVGAGGRVEIVAMAV